MQLYSINKRERFGKMENGFLLLFGSPTPIAKFSITDSLIQSVLMRTFQVFSMFPPADYFRIKKISKKNHVYVYPQKLYIYSSSFKIDKYTMQELKFALFAIYAKDCDFFFVYIFFASTT